MTLDGVQRGESEWMGVTTFNSEQHGQRERVVRKRFLFQGDASAIQISSTFEAEFRVSSDGAATDGRPGSQTDG